MDSSILDTFASLLGPLGFSLDDIEFMLTGKPTSFDDYPERDRGYWHRLSCAIYMAFEFHPRLWNWEWQEFNKNFASQNQFLRRRQFQENFPSKCSQEDDAYQLFYSFLWRMKNMIEISDADVSEDGSTTAKRIVLPNDFSSEDFAVLYILNVIKRFLSMFIRNAKTAERGFMIGDALLQLGPTIVTAPILKKLFDIANTPLKEGIETWNTSIDKNDLIRAGITMGWVDFSFRSV